MQHRFTTGDLLKATGVHRDAFQTWMRRKEIDFPAGNIEGGDGPGSHRQFSLHALIHFAVGVELVISGLPPATAFEAAMKFAYLGEPFFQYGDPQSIPSNYRRVGMPFHHTVASATYLVVPGGRASQARVIKASGHQLPLDEVREVEGASAAFVALDVGKVWGNTLRKLGMDPEAELRAAYERA